MSTTSRTDRSLQLIEVVPDRLEGAPVGRRRRWSAAFKTAVVTRSFEPGANVSALAREIGIKPSQLFGWRSEAVRSGKVARSDETGCMAQGAVSSGTTIEIAINGMTVRVGDGVGEDRLRRVLRVVRST